MLILGIDPGTQKLGIGIVRKKNHKILYITSGHIKLAKQPMEQKLLTIHTEITEVIQQYNPTALAIEKVFFAVNAQSALLLSQVRGVVLLIAAQNKLSVAEYAPKSIKASVSMSGGAGKSQVGFMVQNILKLDDKPQEDAADALAVAICHAYNNHDIF